MQQHVYLKNEQLFPRAITLEQDGAAGVVSHREHFLGPRTADQLSYASFVEIRMAESNGSFVT